MSCHRFAANQARLLMGILNYNLLHMLRQFYLRGEEVTRSIEGLIKRLLKVGAKVAYHGRRWQVHVASAFPWFDTTGLCSDDEHRCEKWLTEAPGVRYAQKRVKNSFFKRDGGS